MPGLNLNGVEKLLPPSSRPLVQPPVMATVPVRVGPCWKAPLNMMMVVWFVQGFECSLSLSGGGYLSTLWRYDMNLGQILKGYQR